MTEKMQSIRDLRVILDQMREIALECHKDSVRLAAENETLREENARCQEAAKLTQQELRDGDTKLTALLKDLRDKNLGALGKAIDNVRDDVSALADVKRDYEKKCEEQERLNYELNEKLITEKEKFEHYRKEKQDRLDSQEQSITEQNTQMDKREKELDDRESSIREREEQYRKKEEALEQQGLEVLETQKKLEEREETCSKREKRKESLETAIRKLTAQLREIEKKFQAYNRAAQQNEAISHNKSV